jgi:hypothetical protein
LTRCRSCSAGAGLNCGWHSSSSSSSSSSSGTQMDLDLSLYPVLGGSARWLRHKQGHQFFGQLVMVVSSLLDPASLLLLPLRLICCTFASAICFRFCLGLFASTCLLSAAAAVALPLLLSLSLH